MISFARDVRDEWRSAGLWLRIAVLSVVAASLSSLLLTLFNYPVIGHDAYVHLNWLDQFTRLRALGAVYPRWLPRSFGGYGSPAFYYYPPLPYFVGSLLSLVKRLPANELYNLLCLFATLISLATSWRALGAVGGTKLGRLTGTLLYSFLAYRLLGVFVRDAFTEHWALAFMPLLFAAGDDTSEDDTAADDGWLKRVFVLSIGWSLMFLTSLPMSYVAAVSVAVWIASRKAWRELLAELAGGAIGALVAGVYLTPALMMRGDIHSEHLWDLPMQTSRFGFALLDLLAGSVDLLRVVSVAMLLSGVILVTAQLRGGQGGRDHAERAWLWLLCLTVVMQLPFMRPLWEALPGLSYVQFSWRWCGPLLLAIAMIAAGSRGAVRNCVTIGLAVLTIACAVVLGRNILHRPTPAIDWYYNDAPEYQPHWTPSDPGETKALTERRAAEPAARILGLAQDRDTVAMLTQGAERWRFMSRLAAPTAVRFHMFYWPQWVAYDSLRQARGPEIALKPDATGIACATLPAGDHMIVLELRQSSWERIGAMISLVGLFVISALAGALVVQKIVGVRPRAINS